MSCKLKVYTRTTEEGKYPDGLAYSVHFGIETNGCFEPLHNNYALLFPKATIDERNVIVPKFTGNVKITKAASNNCHYITGEDIFGDGALNPESNNLFWTWTTEDFISFEELGLISSEEISKISGLAPADFRVSDSIEISEEEASKIKYHWNPLPEEEKKIQSANCTTKLGFPLADGFADPVVLLWKDEYYYIATNDNVNDIGLYVRKSHELDDLFKPETEMHIILDKDEKRGLIQTFWAPEFHVINGSLYILFAVSNEQWGPQCHIMKLKDGGDILNPEDWENPVKVRGINGTNIGEHGITLDMTYVKSGNRHYYVWSYREKIGTPLDSGSMVMIGEFNQKNPYELITEPVCLTRPLYGFENTKGTINNEGPYAFYHDGTIYLSYSGGDARGYLYTVGMLTAKDGADLCDINSWKKAKTPVLNFSSVPGELGSGHNSFFCDRENNWWIAYHAVKSYEERNISTGIRRIYFDSADEPRFD